MTLPLTDPFDSATDARPDEIEVRGRTWGKPKPRCDVIAPPKKRAKAPDYNPQQQGWFRRNGWTFYRTEKPNTFGAVTVDMWGFVDYIACKPGEPITLINVTSDYSADCKSGGHAAEHRKKARGADEFPAWLESGGVFELHLWSQPGGKGNRWVMRRQRVTEDEHWFVGVSEPPGPRSDLDAIAADVLRCACAWNPAARLLGNVRADEFEALCRAFLEGIPR